MESDQLKEIVLSNEKDLDFLMKAVNSDNAMDSVMERDIIALKTKVSILEKVVLALFTAVLGGVVAIFVKVLL